MAREKELMDAKNKELASRNKLYKHEMEKFRDGEASIISELSSTRIKNKERKAIETQKITKIKRIEEEAFKLS